MTTCSFTLVTNVAFLDLNLIALPFSTRKGARNGTRHLVLPLQMLNI